MRLTNSFPNLTLQLGLCILFRNLMGSSLGKQPMAKEKQTKNSYVLQWPNYNNQQQSHDSESLFKQHEDNSENFFKIQNKQCFYKKIVPRET